MSLPQTIKDRLRDDYNIFIDSESPVSGGSINRAYRISTNEGDLFLKYNSGVPEDFFKKEADGLRLLASAPTGLRVPDVIASQAPAGNSPGFLIIEFIETGRRGNAEEFGQGLAGLHKKEAEKFGLEENNYIGSLPQSNNEHQDWPAFFSEERIKPQLKMAVDAKKMDPSVLNQWDRMSAKLDDLLPKTTPRLIHGDLWSGNYLYDSNGRAVLIDPAVYYGHPEMDLAFSKMFGGFSPEFYSGYESVSPLENGFDERVPIYNLYPLLVHVNLFGGHYIRQAESVLDKFS